MPKPLTRVAEERAAIYVRRWIDGHGQSRTTTGGQPLRIAAITLALLCVLSTLAGCATTSQTGSRPSDEERCVASGGMWSGDLCRSGGRY
jgi:hypothetical protein